MSDGKKLKQFPLHQSDEDAERFVDEADLSEYDFSDFRPVRFRLKKPPASNKRAGKKASPATPAR